MLATLEKPHNGHLAALFPEVTRVEFFRKELECIIGFDDEKLLEALCRMTFSVTDVLSRHLVK